MTTDTKSRAIGYCRVSTEGQGDSGLGLDAQKDAIHRRIEGKGWTFQSMYVDVGSGSSTKGRSDLAAALEVLHRGDADVLVVAKLDRVSRSLADFAGMLQLSADEGWALVAVDIDIDTSTINGELMAHILMALAQWERRMIGARTREALAQVKLSGRQLGRPVSVPRQVEDSIRVLRADGRSYYSIARSLNDQAVPTVHGGVKWHPSTVRSVYERLTR